MTLGRMETLCSSDEMPSRIGDCWLAGRFLLNRLNDLESNANGIMYSFCVINLSVTQHHTHVSPAGSTRVAWISPVSNMDRWDRILLCTFKNFAVVCALYHCHYRPITGEVKQKSFITLIMLRNSLKYLSMADPYKAASTLTTTVAVFGDYRRKRHATICRWERRL